MSSLLQALIIINFMLVTLVIVIFQEKAFTSSLEASIDIYDDTQNVHDPTLVRELADKYARLKELNGERTTEYLPDILDFLSDVPNIERVITAILDNNYITSIKAYEVEVLEHVWQRINSPDNIHNRDKLKDMFKQMISECIESNELGYSRALCINGRVSRLLSTFVLLDADELLAASLQTSSIIRAEIMYKCKKIQEEYLNYIKTQSPTLYRQYIDGVDSEATDEINSILHQQMDQFIKLYEPRMNKYEYNDVREQVLAAVA